MRLPAFADVCQLCVAKVLRTGDECRSNVPGWPPFFRAGRPDFCEGFGQMGRQKCGSYGNFEQFPNKWVRDKILRSSGQGQGVVARGMLVQPVFPEAVQAATGVYAPQGEDILGASTKMGWMQN